MANVRGCIALAGGVLIHITLGTMYTFGNMNTYMTSYLKDHVDPDIEYSKSIWINALAQFGQGAIAAFGGYLEQRIGPRWSCLLGCFVFSGAILLTYFTIDVSLIAVATTYGFISSLGLGIAYIAPLVTAMRWFPENKGLVTGITVGGFGIGALIFNGVQSSYLNPYNLPPDKDGYFRNREVLDRVPSVFLLLGGVYLTMQLIGICLLFRPPSNKQEVINLLSSDEDSSSNESPVRMNLHEHKELEKEICMGPRDILKKKNFYMLWATFALTSQAGQFINALYKAYGQTFITDDHFLAIVGSIASVFNGGGRIVWGQLQDRSSYKTCMICLCTSLSALMLSIVLTSRGGKILFTIWILAIFFTFSGLYVLFPTVTAQMFGAKHAGTNYGLLFTSPAISSLVGAAVIQVSLPSLGWFGSFCLIASFSILGLVITCFIPTTEKKRQL